MAMTAAIDTIKPRPIILSSLPHLLPVDGIPLERGSSGPGPFIQVETNAIVFLLAKIASFV